MTAPVPDEVLREWSLGAVDDRVPMLAAALLACREALRAVRSIGPIRRAPGNTVTDERMQEVSEMVAACLPPEPPMPTVDLDLVARHMEWVKRKAYDEEPPHAL